MLLQYEFEYVFYLTSLYFLLIGSRCYICDEW